MEYDEEYVQRYRQKAITDLANFHVGKTYFSNGFGKFTVRKFLTNRQNFENIGGKWEDSDEHGDRIGWFEVEGEKVRKTRVAHSLLDNNIGAAYNPWLIFEDEKTMEEYKSGLEITYCRDCDC